MAGHAKRALLGFDIRATLHAGGHRRAVGLSLWGPHPDLTSAVSLLYRDPEVDMSQLDAVLDAAPLDTDVSTEQLTEPADPRDSWRDDLAPYGRPDLRRSVLDIMTSVVPYVALSVLMYLLVDRSYPLTLLLAIPAAGFLVRTYIVFHDCTHGSFLPSKRANFWVGSAAGLLVFQTFPAWRHAHAVHHATAGDLDRRGVGDLPTITVAEYNSRSRKQQLAYKLFRYPLVMFGIGPIVALVIQPRIVPRTARPRIKRGVHATNATLVALVGGLCLLVGPWHYLLVQGPISMLAGAAGIWLFYVQHQFEDVYWSSGEQWSYVDTALRGSSYLKLPKVLQFFSGNIGLHHVHHLYARVPNYNLQRAHEENPIFHDVPVLSLWDGLRAVRLKLYDEERGRMVTFAQAREVAARHRRPDLVAEA
jgi:omega-6 fatty acid desaturase (delta-12 desaturase)